MNQPLVRVYSADLCPYCERAKQLLTAKGVPYEEIRIDQDPEARDLMIKESGGKRSVPQIFIGPQSVGGFTDLWALEQAGTLNTLLEIKE